MDFAVPYWNLATRNVGVTTPTVSLGFGSAQSEYYQMGDDLPVIEFGLGRRAVQLDAGNSHVCALLEDGNMRCWGDNIAGQLGTESTSNVSNAVSGSDVILPTGVSIKDFTVGSVRTCIVTTDDAIYCWGYADYGALGNGSAEIIGDGCTGSNTASSLRDCSGAVSEMGDSLCACRYWE